MSLIKCKIKDIFKLGNMILWSKFLEETIKNQKFF